MSNVDDLPDGPLGILLLPFALASDRVERIRPGQGGDLVVTVLQWSRTLLGLVATVWLVFAYPVKVGREDFVMGRLEDLLISCGVTFAVGLLAVTAFIAAARAPFRRLYASCLFGPAYCVFLILLGAGLCWLAWQRLFMHRFTIDHVADSWWVNLLILLLEIAFTVLSIFLLLGGVPFTVIFLIYGVNSCFRLGDVHALLPALLSPLLVWSLFVLNFSDGSDVAAPASVINTFLLGGPVTVTLLSVWEVLRLRRRHGVTLRSALGRNRPAPAPVAP